MLQRKDYAKILLCQHVKNDLKLLEGKKVFSSCRQTVPCRDNSITRELMSFINMASNALNTKLNTVILSSSSFNVHINFVILSIYAWVGPFCLKLPILNANIIIVI